MNTASPCCEKSASSRYPALEMLLLIGLPVAVLFAGAIATSVVFNSHLTPVEPPVVQQAR